MGGGGGGGKEKGAEGVREAEVEGAGGGIHKLAGSGRNRGNYATLHIQYFAIEKTQRGGSQQK